MNTNTYSVSRHTLVLCSGLNFKTNFVSRNIEEYILMYG